jgi:transcriptional regulator of acetoin/glycerol metabolism
LQRQALLTALERHAWDPEAAAAELGVSRATVYRRMKKHGLSA